MRRQLALAVGLIAVLSAANAAAQGKQQAAQGRQQKGAQPNGSKAGADVVQMSPDQQRTVGLRTESVVSRAIVSTLRIPGTIVLDPTRMARLRPLVEARVARLLVQPGETVEAGSPLAELNSMRVASAQQSLLVGRATLREAEAGVSVARAALHRGVVLARDGALAWAEADRRRLLLVQAESRKAAAQAGIVADQVAVESLGAGKAAGVAQLTTPIKGVVAAIHATPGEVIEPNMAADAFTIADLSIVEALAQVPQGQTDEVRVGAKAGVQLASGGSRGWNGTVVAISASIDPSSRTLPIRIRLANPEGVLREGMLVDVVVFDDRGEQGLIVPPGAVQAVGDRQVVFTPLGHGRFRSQEVKIGVRREDWVQVLQGLSVGEQVVTNGSFALKSVLQSAMLGGG